MNLLTAITSNGKTKILGETMKIIARHKWLVGCMITESHDEAKSTDDKVYCRFTATIRGWRNFVIYEGFCFAGMAEDIMTKVRKIRDKIDVGDDSVFLKSERILEKRN